MRQVFNNANTYLAAAPKAHHFEKIYVKNRV